MPPLLSCAAVREREQRAVRELGMPTLLLMENAGRGCAELLRSLGIAGRVVVCSGKGNNGGDGLVIARHLDNAGVAAHVLLFARPDELSPDSAVNLRLLGGNEVAVDVHAGPAPPLERVEADLAAADWVVDALFGTGLHGPLGPPFDAVAGLINAGPARVLAVDIPSGLDGDTGRPAGAAVRAHHTATLLAWKKGFAEPAAQQWLGQVHLVDIGLPRRYLP